jgi:hypothetical protein
MVDTQSSEDLVKLLKTKTDLLRLVNEDTKALITKAKISELERQRKTLDDKLQEVHDFKLRIQETKLGEGVKPEEVRAWTDETKANDIVPIEEAISELETVITTAKGKELRRKSETKSTKRNLNTTKRH